DYDVYGDGSLVLIDTKGHTRGHQSIVVNLAQSGKIVLAVDAASLKENLDDDIRPGREPWNTAEGMKSLAKLRKLRDEGAFLIYGHEASQWDSLKKAPAHYE
ncbi:MAG: N-acyl homoserine lactonase family protein, partial [Clostridiales Family XIII bacterium]|nr:N-acyl homoserine lactonase family protein [Clostridiales Family XIII bacterium]